MGKWRCDIRDDQQRQCLLRSEHAGKVPCSFGIVSESIATSRKPKKSRASKRELRQPELAEMDFSIPLLPPSVNHYKLPRKGGRGYYLTPEARAFQAAVGSLTRGSVRHDWYEIHIRVYLGKDQRGDADNFNKVVLDALVKARIITTDARVKPTIEPLRDWENPRTEVSIREWKR